jgi:hypothetical protein
MQNLRLQRKNLSPDKGPGSVLREGPVRFIGYIDHASQMMEGIAFRKVSKKPGQRSWRSAEIIIWKQADSGED